VMWAKASGVSVETLRYYERRGILVSPARTPSGYRVYPGDGVRVVRFVKHAQELGFSLDDIAGLLRLADGGPDNCDAVSRAKTHCRPVTCSFVVMVRLLVGIR
jgi:MerR family mercuric resistance operon transcriptional regulator